MARIMITGSSGLIGSEVAIYLAQQGNTIIGVDNNQRAVFFGPQGDTTWNLKRILELIPDMIHESVDIRDRDKVLALVNKYKPDAIIHAAAQPSHDRAAAIPFDDFDTNAVGTINLLEAARRNCPESPFVFLSTNKVYGDAPNRIPLIELESRWEYNDAAFITGINESFSIDHSKHSLFGASKVAADIMVQEYGRYFGMPTVCLRGGCLTGPSHSGVELHGFLSYLVKCNVQENKYFIYGYKGKQVRDNIHSYDVARFVKMFIDTPKSAAVYNIGGGKSNSCSILEAFEIVERYSGRTQIFEYVDKAREGDHICYYSDLNKMKSDYPNWDISISLDEIIEQIVENWLKRR